MNVRDSRVHNYPPRWNAAPSQELLVIRRNHQTGEVSLDALRWGLIPYWCQDPAGGRKPINAKCETVRDLPTFRDAYRRRRCIVPVDGFFEWRAIKGLRAKQLYAIAMKDGAPFGLAGIWEIWREPSSGEWLRTFAIITTDANELVADIHDRMPVILAPGDYARWLGEERDSRDLMPPFPSDLIWMWPISTRVNKPENDDPSMWSRSKWQRMRRSTLSHSLRVCHLVVLYGTKRNHLGPGDCARPRRVRNRQRSCREVRRRSARGHRRQVPETHLPLDRLHRSAALRFTPQMLGLRHGGHPVLKWCFENVAIHTDSTGNRTMHKGKSRDRIDGAVACWIAVSRAAVGANNAFHLCRRNGEAGRGCYSYERTLLKSIDALLAARSS